MDNVFRKYWTDAEEAKLFRTIRSRMSPAARRDAAWLSLLVKTGLRIGEFSRLTAPDATAALESRWLFVPRENRKKDRNGKAIDHQVPVTGPVKHALDELLRILWLDGWNTKDGATPLVASREGKALSVRSYQARIAYWCKEAGVPDGSPHFARHTRAMRIYRNSTSADPLGVVQAALGQRSRASTSIYAGVTKEDLQRELVALDGGGRVRKKDLRRRYEERGRA